MENLLKDPLHPDSLEEINKFLVSCRLCPLNKEPYNPGAPVPGIGIAPATIMIIGEAPGEHEAEPAGYQVDDIETGRPFIGVAGKALKRLLQKLGYSFGFTYISNVAKHRPPGNRNPTAIEIRTCSTHILSREIEIVKPKVIVCLGRVAASAIASLADYSLPRGTIRGHRFMFGDINIFCTWHPAYACGYNKDAEPELEADLQEVLNEFSPQED